MAVPENSDEVANPLPEAATSSSFWRSCFRFFSFAAIGAVFVFIWDISCCFIYGRPLHKRTCRVEFPDDLRASNTKTITVTFLNSEGEPVLNPSSIGRLTVEVFRGDAIRVEGSTVSESANGHSLNIIFNATVAGSYSVHLKSNGFPVWHFPADLSILPGRACPEKTTFVGLRSQTMVMRTGSHETIKLDPRDKFGNIVDRLEVDELTRKLSVSVVRFGDDAQVGEERTLIYQDPNSANGELCLTFAFSSFEKGWYKAKVTLDGKKVGARSLTLLVLEPKEMERVNSLLHSGRHGSSDYFEGDIVSIGEQACDQPRRAFCYLTPKQLSIREYILRIIPRRTTSFRMAPITKVKLKRFDHGTPVIAITDGFTNRLEIRLVDGNIFSACFHLTLLRRIGGSESFTDKKVYFNLQLAQHHRTRNHHHTRMGLKIDRFNLITSSVRATKNLTEADWCQLFAIEFEGEPGVDHGGLRREWFQIVCDKLFSPALAVFVPVEEGSHALMPNPDPPSFVRKLNLFKFAGKMVGKCLYESAQGQAYEQNVPFRFAKSFLAQLVGLRAHYQHFADDAPEFFSAKIARIRDTEIGSEGSGLEDLTFSEEVPDSTNASSVRTVNLKPNGSSIPVTDHNKMEYLDLLAQYRLSSRVKEPLEQFLEGLNLLIPDHLLTLFDENELELLISGVRDYKLDDFKRFHSVIFGTPLRTVAWFWLALDHFTQEQIAKLLQFTTGSSQLPSSGFSGLTPQFQISSSGTRDNLPTAHTCFNMICLPEYDSFADFERALLTAITEGSEGFGFA